MISFETPFSVNDVGYYEDRLNVLNNHFAKMIEAKELQGANYCLARDGKVFVNTALGKLCYKDDDNRPLLPDTIHNLASITKLFCATAIFKLVEDGKIRLDQTIGEFISEFSNPPFNKINIAHLLSHTSGLPADEGCFENKYFKSPWYYIDTAKDENWIKAALSCGMRNEPGKEWAYCTFGYQILGEVISKASGVFANDYIIENIVRPCNMTDTKYNLSVDDAKRHCVPSQRIEKHMAAILSGEKSDTIWDKVPLTGYGLNSTATDLCKFGTMLLNKGTYEGTRVISRKAIEKMTALYTTPDIRDYCWGAGGVIREYGLGPDLRCNLASLYGKGTFFHEGAGGCCLIVDPAEKLVAAWFVPFVNDVWCAHSLYNVSAIRWSGLK